MTEHLIWGSIGLAFTLLGGSLLGIGVHMLVNVFAKVVA